MTERYILNRHGVWISKATGKPMRSTGAIGLPTIRSDLPAYISPVTKKPVEGRAARREDLARAGAREVDPSEYRPTYENKHYAEANGGVHEPRKAADLGNGYIRLPTDRR